MQLVIYFEFDCPNGCLNGFPFKEGQFTFYESEGPSDFHSAIWIELGKEDDVSSAQAVFLNSCEWVISYSIV